MRRAYLAAEFAVLYLALPLALWRWPGLVRGVLIPSLVVGSLGMVLFLRRDPSFDRRRLWGARGWTRRLRGIALPFAAGAPVLGFAFALVEPERLFAFPRQAPLFWLLVCLLYPLLSVYPQELIFRVFLFHRYRELFRSEGALVTASALTFGAAHLFFSNPIAPALSTVGGFLFARTYARTGTVFPACVEHALWGDFLFTVGLGWYFYTGSIA